MSGHPINLGFRFLLEVAALASAGYWGWMYFSEPVRFVLAGALPIILAVLWAMFAAPNDQIGVNDLARRFALESGVAPSFRELIKNRALQQTFPFALEQAMKPGPEEVFDPHILSTSEFADFLQEAMGGESQSIGQSLRGAADFLRTPDWEGNVFSPQQDFIRVFLINEGYSGSQLFAPTIELLTQRQHGRSFGGFDVSGAIQRSIRNQLAAEPLRFQTVAEFLDYLAEQGII